MNKADFIVLYEKAKKETGVSWARPDVAYSQAVHETGNFTSRIYKNFNNAFGMGVATKRKTTNNGHSGSTEGQAKYKNVLDSMKDHLYYLDSWSSGRYRNVANDPYKTIWAFQDHSMKYASDPAYVAKLTSIYKSHWGGSEVATESVNQILTTSQNNVNLSFMEDLRKSIETSWKKLPQIVQYGIIGGVIYFLYKKFMK